MLSKAVYQSHYDGMELQRYGNKHPVTWNPVLNEFILCHFISPI